jgi:type I restriction enzyme S subunit
MQTTLGKECSIEIGGTPSRGVDAYWDTDRSTENAWVSIKDMHSRAITDTAERISDLGVRRSNVKLQAEGTVLLSFKLTIGRVAFAGIPLYTNEAIAGLQSRTIDSKYLYQGLQQWNLLQGVDQAIKGATLNKAKLKKISFVCPESRTEQSKIAEVLSTVDRAIAQNEAMIAKQQRIKTGLMHDLLTRGIDEHGQLRSEATHVFKNSPLGRIPVEWDVSSFGDAGRWFSGGTPSKANARFWNGGVPWICPKDMKQLELGSSIETITGYAVSTGVRLMPIGTVLIVIRGMILAHTFPVGYATCELAFNQDMKAIVAKEGLNARHLAYWLMSRKHEFLKLTTTATHGTKRFDTDELSAVPMQLPGPEEQEQIVRILDHQQSAIDIMQDQARKLRQLRTALMQDLLTGKIRVTPLLQPAEAASHG